MRTCRLEIFGSKIRFFGTDGKLQGERVLEESDVAQLIAEVEAGYKKSAPAPAALGQKLYRWLDGAQDCWLATARKGKGGLAVHIDCEKRLRHLPWEIVSEDHSFLCGPSTKPFAPVRRVGNDAQDVEPQNRPLRVLFMASSPLNVTPVLAYEDEENRILQATGERQIELVVEESGSLPGLTERVEWHGEDHFDVFHLTGHADVRDDEPIFTMEDDVGLRQDVTASELAEAFGGRWPRLIFLSGCKTGEAPQEGILPSFCERMVEAGAPAVLGWALPVLDTTATQAAEELYHHLAVGVAIDETVARARAQLLKNKAADWHLLRLYADATELSPLVTAPGKKGREKLRVRPAQKEFLDAGAKGEVCAREFFVGRRRAIQRCLRILRALTSSEDYCEGILLHGMGGLGKSSLAARLCERMQGYQRVVLVGKVDEDELREHLNEKLKNPDAAQVFDEKRLPLKQRLVILLEQYIEEPMLFVFDDFEQNVEGYEEDNVQPDADRRALLKSDAQAVLRGLLEAIRETACESRVLVTCRYLFAQPSRSAGLYEEPLERLRDAEERKKVMALEEGLPNVTAEQRKKVSELAAGNPRLLERLYRVLADPQTDHQAILLALHAKALVFREETLLSMLLGQQSEVCRKVLALVSILELPITRAAVEELTGGLPLDPDLERASALGLIETGKNPPENTVHYYVSGILRPLLTSEIDGNQREEACARIAKHLYDNWWHAPESPKGPEAHELLRLALLGGVEDVAVEITTDISCHLVYDSRFREAKAICLRTLKSIEDYRVLHQLARAEVVLGETGDAKVHYERSLELCPRVTAGLSEEVEETRSGILFNLGELQAQLGDVAEAMRLYRESLKIAEQIGDVRVKAATLHNMSGLQAQLGDVAEAMRLNEEALKFSEQIGDVRGKATTLHNMARLHAQRGDVAEAMRLYEEALEIEEKIGDVRGKAATLHQMAGLQEQLEDVAEAMRLYEESLKLTEQIGHVRGKAATLHQMARLQEQLGDVAEAMRLYEEALEIEEQIGNVRGKAVTLANMAGLSLEAGDGRKGKELYLEAARGLFSIRAWPDAFTVLGNLGSSEEPEAVSFLAQAAWLALHVEVPVTDTVGLSVELFSKLGAESKVAPLLATYANLAVIARGENHREREELLKASLGMLQDCAAERNVPEDGYQEWFEGERLNNLDYLKPELKKELEKIIGEHGWLFNPKAVTGEKGEE